MAPIPMTNGVHNGMPLTEYSANPTPKKTAASSLVPEAFLLPDGHPDVCYWQCVSLPFTDSDTHSTFA